MDKIIINLAFISMLLWSTISCTSHQKEIKSDQNQPTLPTWMIGEWQQEDGEDDYCELWEQKQDTLIGLGYFKEQDISKIDEMEHMKIFAINQKIIQRTLANNKAIDFVISSLDQHSILMKNPDSSGFPSFYKYTLLNENQLIIEVSGEYNGEIENYAFNMFRKK